MCNWRSNPPALLLTPSQPPRHCRHHYTHLPHIPALLSPPLLASPAAVVGVVSASTVTKLLVFQLSRSLPSRLFFFCRSLARHKITEAVLTSLSTWPNTLPFSLSSSSSSSTPESITHWLEPNIKKWTMSRKLKKKIYCRKPDIV